MSTMVQLVPALVLAIAAFLTAAFALIYSMYPLLPPHRIWKQVSTFHLRIITA